jgi:molybdopterin synthase catalytic subunit
VSDVVRLLDIRDEQLSVGEVYAAVTDPRTGGVSVFVGTVREHDAGRQVRSLTYSAHPTAVDQMGRVAASVAEAHDVQAVAAVHRVGKLEVGDIAVVVAVSAAHRGTAISACRQLIDELKATVPIWKHQEFSDGTEEWVGTP